MPEFRRLADLFAAFGERVGSPHDVDEIFTVVTSVCVQAIDSADAAAVTVHRNGHFETVAATDDLPGRVDSIQYQLTSGPCIDAVLEEAVFRSNDLRIDTRWPEFARRAVQELGVLSMMSFRMFFEDSDLLCGLNVYATKPDAFDDLAETTGLALSAQAALALTAVRERKQVETLEQALISNRDIGTAMGILMARHLATRQQAFDMLRVASQHTHRKLADVALDVIDTGLLSYPGPRPD